MPQINGQTTEDTNGVFTNYTGNATETIQNYTFTTAQNGMRFVNKGDAPIKLTVDGKLYNVPPRLDRLFMWLIRALALLMCVPLRELVRLN